MRTVEHRQVELGTPQYVIEQAARGTAARVPLTRAPREGRPRELPPGKMTPRCLEWKM